MPVCILGMHRSGTSMVTRLLNVCGLYLGEEQDIMPPSADNEMGYWEHWRFVEINDELLQLRDATWSEPPSVKTQWAQGDQHDLLRHRVAGLITEFNDATHWGWKDPRATLNIEFWESASPDLKYIVCLRNPIDVASSLDKRVYESLTVGFDNALDLWLAYAEALRLQLPKDRYIVTHYESFFYDAGAELHRLLDFLEMEVSEEALEEALGVIRGNLRHHFTNEQVLKVADLAPEIVQHYRSFCLEAGPVFEQMLKDDRYQRNLLEGNIQKLYNDVQERNQELRDRDAIITELDNKVAVLEADQAFHQQILEEIKKAHQTQIGEIYHHVNQNLHQLYEDVVQALEATNEVRHQDIQQLPEAPGGSQTEIQRLQNENARLNQLVTDMSNTRGWRLLTKWWRIKKALSFPRFRRNRIYHLTRSGTAVLLKEGPVSFTKQGLKWLRGERGYYQFSPMQQVADRLHYNLDTNLDEPFIVGKGNVLHLEGWCYHTQKKLNQVRILFDGKARQVDHAGIPRIDVLQIAAQYRNLGPHSLASGFMVDIPIEPITEPRCVEIGLEVRFSRGKVERHSLGNVQLVPSITDPETNDLPAPPFPEDGPFVVICMATYNPKRGYFEEQIETIINQTHRNWICIINDDCSDTEYFEHIQQVASRDSRFKVFRNEKNLGFYHNFQRALTRVPEEAEFVALSDHDDIWFPEKLGACLEQFEPGVTLVYSDMNIVTEDGKLVSETYWTTRSNNYRDLEILLFTNTLTGAASVFRASLLPYILPFPQYKQFAYHDHWIGSVALAMGEMRYIDRSLYAYRQHDGNVIGHTTPVRRRFVPWLSKVLQARVFQHRAMSNPGSQIWQTLSHFYYLVLLVYWARVLQVRIKDMPEAKRQVVRDITEYSQSVRRLGSAVLRYREMQHITLGHVQYCILGLMAKRRLQTYSRLHQKRVLQHIARSQNQPEGLALAAQQISQPTRKGFPEAWQESLGTLSYIPMKIAPIQLNINAAAPTRINLVFSEIKFKYFFGGYYAVFKLAMKLQGLGYRVRVVLVDECDFDLPVWRREIKKYDGLEDFFDRIEVVYHYDRSRALEVSPHDQFVPTSWWTAHIAHGATQEIGWRNKFVYLTQEFEPIFYPGGTYYALANESYTFPHYALYSTEFLREYAQLHRLGPFMEGISSGEENSISFQNAIMAYPPSIEQMRQRRERKLLFYARPESHARRNAFELGILALRKAVGEGHFANHNWAFHGIGAAHESSDIPVINGIGLTMLPKLGLQDFYKLITSYDIGLCLMMSPHPSLMPLDLAAAGALSITNTFANKTSDKISAISPNIIAAEPTIRGLKDALVEATRRVDDLDQRLAGTRLNWATTWDEAFNDQIMKKFRDWLESTS